MGRIFKLIPKLGAVLFLILLVWGCGAVPGLKEGSEAGYIRIPFVRVLLNNGADNLEMASTGTFSLECIRAGKSMVYYSSRPVTVTPERGRLTVWMKGGKIDGGFDEILVAPRRHRDLLKYGAHRYRGMFRIIPHGVNLRLINIVHLDDYLKGVVPPEIGKLKENELEAAKAQAVAARTYSMAHLSQYGDEPFDMKTDVSDQVYHGVEVEEKIISRAIDATRGYVIKYKDKLINAYYHSTCGGSTDYIEEVWERTSMPYLQAVTDDKYCSWSKYYDWTETFSGPQLKLLIEQYLSAERGREIRIDDIIDIIIGARTAGGRVAELTVRTAAMDYTFGKDKIRWVFRRASNPELILQSARFDVRLRKNEQGQVTRIDLDGHGYGHGVGMCQCGAIGMARDGKKYADILTHYYRNVQLARLY